MGAEQQPGNIAAGWSKDGEKLNGRPIELKAG